MKPVLGRNLGTLLGGPVTSAAPEASAAQTQLPLQQPGPGVRSLLRGQSSTAEPAETPSLPVQENAPAPVSPLIPSWYFFAADILMVALALLLIYHSPATAGWGVRLFAMGLVALGGCLGVVGVWIKSRD